MAKVKIDKLLGDAREKDAASYDFVQAVASTVWSIPHNLGGRPTIKAYETGNDCPLKGSEKYIDDNTTELRFLWAVSGIAKCIITY